MRWCATLKTVENVMIKSFVVALTGAALTVSAPALAREPAGKPAPAPALSSSPADVTNPKIRYCFIEDVTGSRIPRKSCKTRADWLAEGIDPLKG
jgi:hypothetical protein